MPSFTFNASGTWACPPGVTSVKIQCWGSGGNGGTSTSGGSGGGGGGGGYSEDDAVAVTPNKLYNFTVGQGGQGTSTPTQFSGDSANVIANAGSNGVVTQGGGGGGIGTGATYHTPGGTGGNGNATANYGGGGGGGSGGGSTGLGGSAGAAGAASGSAAGGAGGTGTPTGYTGGTGGTAGAAGNGGVGAGPGAGGGGGSYHTTAGTGAAGQAGQLIITYTTQNAIGTPAPVSTVSALGFQPTISGNITGTPWGRAYSLTYTPSAQGRIYNQTPQTTRVYQRVYPPNWTYTTPSPPQPSTVSITTYQPTVTIVSAPVVVTAPRAAVTVTGYLPGDTVGSFPVGLGAVTATGQPVLVDTVAVTAGVGAVTATAYIPGDTVAFVAGAAAVSLLVPATAGQPTTSQTFTTSGTWICPAGVTQVTIECYGGGGSGGSSDYLASVGGGGGGQYARKNGYAVTPGNSYTYTVGGGGALPALNAVGNAGADSWFSPTSSETNAVCIAKPGLGGGYVGAPAYGGAGGTGGTGDFLTNGGAGGDTTVAWSGSVYQPGGGGCGGPTTNGSKGTNNVGTANQPCPGGPGGGGLAGKGGDGPLASTAPVAANNGQNYGGGGAGGFYNGSPTSGAGAPGVIVLTYAQVQNATPTAPAANTGVTAYQPLASVSDIGPAGVGAVTVTGYLPGDTVGSFPVGAPNVGATGYAPSVSTSANATPTAGVGAVTAASLAPTPHAGAGVTAGVGNITVTGYLPGDTVSPAAQQANATTAAFAAGLSFVPGMAGVQVWVVTFTPYNLSGAGAQVGVPPNYKGSFTNMSPTNGPVGTVVDIYIGAGNALNLGGMQGGIWDVTYTVIAAGHWQFTVPTTSNVSNPGGVYPVNPGGALVVAPYSTGPGITSGTATFLVTPPVATPVPSVAGVTVGAYAPNVVANAVATVGVANVAVAGVQAGYLPFTLVHQSNTETQGGTTATFTITASTAGNTLIFLFTNSSGDQQQISTVTDNQGGTWTKRNQYAATQVPGEWEIWDQVNCRGGITTVTVTMPTTVSANPYRGNISEWQGVAPYQGNIVGGYGQATGAMYTRYVGPASVAGSMNVVAGSVQSGWTVTAGVSANVPAAVTSFLNLSATSGDTTSWFTTAIMANTTGSTQLIGTCTPATTMYSGEVTAIYTPPPMPMLPGVTAFPGVANVSVAGLQPVEIVRAIAPSPSYVSAILSSAPFEYYQLSADATDSSGNGRNGTQTAVQFGVPGPGGFLAARFNGTTSFIYETVSHLNAGLPWTMECWFRVAASGVTEGLMNFNTIPATGMGGGAFTPALYMNNVGNIANFAFPNTVYSGSDSVSSDGNWHHAVATYDGATSMTMWRDGILLAQTSMPSTPPQVNVNLGLQIGVSGNATRGGWFAGDMAHVAIYTRALTPAEVVAHFNAMSGSAMGVVVGVPLPVIPRPVTSQVAPVTVSALNPIISTQSSDTPVTAAAAAAAYNPSVVAGTGTIAVAGLGAVTATAYALGQSAAFTAGVAAATATGYQSVDTVNPVVPTRGSVGVAAPPPVISSVTNIALTAPVVNVVVTGLNPGDTDAFTSPAATVTVTGYIPGDTVAFTSQYANVGATVYAPSITGTEALTAPVVNVGVTAYAPSVTTGEVLIASVVNVAVTSYVPRGTTALVAPQPNVTAVAYNAVGLTAEGGLPPVVNVSVAAYVPTVQLLTPVTAQVAPVAVASMAPQVQAGADATAYPTVANVTVAALNGYINLTHNVPSIGHANITAAIPQAAGAVIGPVNNYQMQTTPGTNSFVVTLPFAPTTGNTLIVMVSDYSVNQVAAIQVKTNNNYSFGQMASLNAGGTANMYMYYLSAIAAGITTLTVSLSGTNGTIGLSVSEWQGALYDFVPTPGYKIGSTSPLTGLTATPTSAGELIINFGSIGTTAVTFSGAPGGGFSNFTAADPASAYGWQITPSLGSFTYTQALSTNHNWASLTGAYKGPYLSPASVVAFAQPTNVTATAYQAGTSTVTNANPTPDCPNVTVAANNAVGATLTTVVAQIANVTVAGLNALTHISPLVTAGVGTITVTAYAPLAATVPWTYAQPNVANVTVNVLIGIPGLVSTSTGQANATVVAYGAQVATLTPVVAPVANVTVSAPTPTVLTGAVGTPGVGTVTETALQPMATKTIPTAQLTNVIVVALVPTLTISALVTPPVATVTITGYPAFVGEIVQPPTDTVQVDIGGQNATAGITPLAGLANVSVGALAPAESLTAGTGAVTVIGRAPGWSITPQTAAVAVSAYPVVNFNAGALSGPAGASVAALGPLPAIGAHQPTGTFTVAVGVPPLIVGVGPIVVPSLGNVTISTYPVFIVAGTGATVTPNVANVTVQAFGEVVAIHDYAFPPAANVAVVANNIGNNVAFTADVAVVVVTAQQPDKFANVPIATATCAAYDATADVSAAGLANTLVTVPLTLPYVIGARDYVPDCYLQPGLGVTAKIGWTDQNSTDSPFPEYTAVGMGHIPDWTGDSNALAAGQYDMNQVVAYGDHNPLNQGPIGTTFWEAWGADAPPNPNAPTEDVSGSIGQDLEY